MADEARGKNGRLWLHPDKFPVTIQARHPISGAVLYKRTIHYAEPGTEDELRLPRLGQRADFELTFGDGEVAVYTDFFVR